ncbi:MAG: hypothetical protein JWM85_1609 [Acidimicrobiaceae bacterium]|nr:hypothetical protein [Acidimicrobiaceae bacterium]
MVVLVGATVVLGAKVVVVVVLGAKVVVVVDGTELLVEGATVVVVAEVVDVRARVVEVALSGRVVVVAGATVVGAPPAPPELPRRAEAGAADPENAPAAAADPTPSTATRSPSTDQRRTSTNRSGRRRCAALPRAPWGESSPAMSAEASWRQPASGDKRRSALWPAHVTRRASDPKLPGDQVREGTAMMSSGGLQRRGGAR